MMIFSNYGIFVVLCIYVDNMLVTGNNAEFIGDLIEKLNSVISLKDWGELSYFLGLEVTQNND